MGLLIDTNLAALQRTTAPPSEAVAPAREVAPPPSDVPVAAVGADQATLNIASREGREAVVQAQAEISAVQSARLGLEIEQETVPQPQDVSGPAPPTEQPIALENPPPPTPPEVDVAETPPPSDDALAAGGGQDADLATRPAAAAVSPERIALDEREAAARSVLAEAERASSARISGEVLLRDRDEATAVRLQLEAAIAQDRGTSALAQSNVSPELALRVLGS